MAILQERYSSFFEPQILLGANINTGPDYRLEDHPIYQKGKMIGGINQVFGEKTYILSTKKIHSKKKPPLTQELGLSDGEH